MAIELKKICIPTKNENLSFKKLKSKIKDISLLNTTTFILLENGKIIGFGNNYYGQLGLPKEKVEYQFLPIKLDFKGEKIISMMNLKLKLKLEWKIERILWIGYFKKEEKTILKKLPIELLKEIIKISI